MECVLSVAALAAIVFGACTLGRRVRLQPPPALPPRPLLPPPAPRPVQRRVQRPDLRQQRDAQSRAFQTALLHLAATPDFRRAARLASAANLVPVAFRRRQFVRFHPALVVHYQRCRAAGTDSEVLSKSLSDLVVALGVAPFEADYIRLAAERVVQQEAPPTLAARMATLKQEHEARVAAITHGLEDDGDICEQLLEAEMLRYQQALEALLETASQERPRSSPSVGRLS